MWQRLSAFIILPALYALPAIAQQTQQSNPQSPEWYGPGPWHMWGPGYGWHFWWMPPFMMLFFFLLCAAVIYLVFARGACGWHAGPADRSTHSALQILNERFAKGEIQKAEYEERKRAILAR